ncbi:hypothetical protein [Geodermatophilus sp. SYSU D00079]
MATALTLLACAVGALGWPLPDRTPSGWQVTDVPAPLLAVVVGGAVLCLALAAGLVHLRAFGSPLAAGAWLALVVATAGALVWHALFLAALVDTGDGPVIPVFDGLLTSVPAFVVGLGTRRHGRAVQTRAVLATAVATLPLVGLGWSLTDGTTGLLPALSGGVYSATVFGVLPVVVALAVTRAAAPGVGREE